MSSKNPDGIIFALIEVFYQYLYQTGSAKRIAYVNAFNLTGHPIQ